MAKNKTESAVILLYALSTISGAFANVLTDLNEYLLIPHQSLANWNPSTGFGKWLHFNLMFWPCVGLILLLKQLATYIWHKWISKIEEEPVTPMVLYKEEFAAAVEAMDFNVTAAAKQEAFQDLLLTVAETICVNLGLRNKDCRMMFFTEKPGQGEFAGYRIGKQHELVTQGRLDPDSFYPKDLEIIRSCLQEQETELVIQNYPFSDAKVVLFTRNPGKFRLGLYIAILKDFDLDVAREVFPQVAHIVTTLGFMDEMTNYIVQCD